MKLPVLLLIALTAACTTPTSPASPNSSDRPAAADESRSLSVVPLEWAVAAEIAAALDGLLPDARVVADLRTNSVILSCASEADLAQLSAAVDRLDVPAGGIETAGSE